MRMDQTNKNKSVMSFCLVGSGFSANSSFVSSGDHFDTKQSRFNHDTEMAMQEARDIGSGKVKTKLYNSTGELFSDLDSE